MYGAAREYLPEPLDLIVGQGIHGIQQQGANAGAQCAVGVLGGQCVENRQQEALGLAGSSTEATMTLRPAVILRMARSWWR